MRVHLNLATRPFGRSRLFWLISGVCGAILALMTVWLAATFWSNRDPSPELAQREAQLQTKLQQLTAEESQLRSTLGAPETVPAGRPASRAESAS